MEQRLSLVTLGVADLARSRAFYENGLGFVKHNDEPEVAFYQLPGIVLALWSRQELATDAGVEDTGATFGGIALAHNARDRAGVDEIVAEALAAGGSLRKQPEPTPWGGYSGYIADPDGHLWEIAHNPDWPIDRDGSVSMP